ncbi:MAG: hypothetical protein K6C36_07425, partial [Clostridia bacterium]|nr:hypothetical protein [Clostridia bacterium]
MTAEYTLFDPTKNVTALVTTEIDPDLRAAAAAKIMEKEPACEQVGFVYTDRDGRSRLDMAGGEFCGNASMAAGLLFAPEPALRQPELLPGCSEAPYSAELYVSGTPGPVEVAVMPWPDGAFGCSVRMPRPEKIFSAELPFEGKTYRLPVVSFPGISHVIVRSGLFTREQAEKAVRIWCRELGVSALGIMNIESPVPGDKMIQSGAEALKMVPLVFVPAADTLFWESSCASGSAALGAYVLSLPGAENETEAAAVDISQPG